MAPMPRTKRGRLRQLEHWLNVRFPPSRRTTVKVCKLDKRELYGDTTRVGNEIRIRIDSTLPWCVSVHYLFHEWAHAMTWPLVRVEDHVDAHSAEWGVALATIFRDFYDGDGWLESRDYPED